MRACFGSRRVLLLLLFLVPVGVGFSVAGDSATLDDVRARIDSGDYAAAQERARALLAELEARAGDDAVEVANVLDVLVESLWRSGKAQEPETRRLAERALRIKTRALGDDDASLADSLNNLAVIGYFLGEFDTAQRHWERALTIREATDGPESLEAAQLMNNLGNLLQVSGDLQRATRLYTRALAIRETLLPAEHPLVAQTLNNLGVLLRFTGDYARALPLAERALAMKEKTLGPDHPKVAESLTALSSLLWETGDYSRAVPMLERAQRIWETSMGPDDVSVAPALNNRAEQLRKLGRHEEARALFERALAIWEAAYDEDHPDIALCLSGLAYLLEETGDYEEAERHQRRAVAIRRKTMGDDNPELAASLHGLGTLLTRRGAFDEARGHLERAVAIRRSSCGGAHPWTAASLGALAVLSALEGDGRQALALALEAEAISRDHLRATGRTFSEQQALSYASSRSRGLDLALTLAERGLAADASREVLDALIRSRAVVLDEMAARNRHALLAGDPETAVLVEGLSAARDRLANLTVRGPAGDDSESYLRLLDEARRSKEQAERALASTSAGYTRARSRGGQGLTEVISRLPADAALVSIVRFDRWDLERPASDDDDRRSRSFDPTPGYLAFVTGPGRTPSVVSLGEATELASVVDDWREEVQRAATVRRRAARRAEADYRRVGELLRRRVWDPLEPGLVDARRVFLVPDGVLNLVSWAALPVRESEYLVEDDTVLHYLSAERDLLAIEGSPASGTGLLALGGPDYDDAAAAEPGQTRATAPSRCAGFAGLRFAPLPAAGEEAREIATLWRAAKSGDGENAAVHLSGVEATEAAFKSRAPGRRVLHLATHGFFLGEDCRAPEGGRGLSVVDDAEPGPAVLPPEKLAPLLRSGLALANANRRSGSGSPEQDGMLTAEEIASLDLTGVEWAVLSACDTGRGEVHAGEGVLGLRRAMQVAGVRTLIMSLWPVDDEATRRWMRALYVGRLERGLDTAQAVRHAARTVLEERRMRGSDTHPFFWSAFVAAGDWR